jgi:hypothetical protein
MPGASTARQHGRGNHRDDLRRLRSLLRERCGDHRDGQRDRLEGPLCHRLLRGGTLMRHARALFVAVLLLAPSVPTGAFLGCLVSGARSTAALLPGQHIAATEAVDVATVATRADLDLRTAPGAAVDTQALLRNRRLPRQGSGRGSLKRRYSTRVERPNRRKAQGDPVWQKTWGLLFSFPLAGGNPTSGPATVRRQAHPTARHRLRAVAAPSSPQRGGNCPAGSNLSTDRQPASRGRTVIYARILTVTDRG